MDNMPKELILLFTQPPKNVIIFLYEGCFIWQNPDFRVFVRIMNNRRFL